jgi:hypothetical protein
MPQPPGERRQLLDTPVKVITILAGLASIVGVYIAWKATSNKDDPPSSGSTVTSTTPNPTTSASSTTKQDYMPERRRPLPGSLPGGRDRRRAGDGPPRPLRADHRDPPGARHPMGQLQPPAADASEVDRILQTTAVRTSGRPMRRPPLGEAQRRLLRGEAEGKRLENQDRSSQRHAGSRFALGSGDDHSPSWLIWSHCKPWGRDAEERRAGTPPAQVVRTLAARDPAAAT